VIITYSKHGRSSRDSANLIAHLQDPENETIEVLAIGNSVASDLAGVVKDMEILRDGCGALGEMGLGHNGGVFQVEQPLRLTMRQRMCALNVLPPSVRR
jgi:hypothetical protein